MADQGTLWIHPCTLDKNIPVFDIPDQP